MAAGGSVDIVRLYPLPTRSSMSCPIPPNVDLAVAQGFFWQCAQGGVGGASLNEILWVDPVDGDDLTAKTGSLVRKWKTIQAALDKALPGQTVAVLGGQYNLGSGGLVWPNTPNVKLWGFVPNVFPGDAVTMMFSLVDGVAIFNDGTVPVLTIAPPGPFMLPFVAIVVGVDLGGGVGAGVASTVKLDGQNGTAAFVFDDCSIVGNASNAVALDAFAMSLVGFVRCQAVASSLITQCGEVQVRQSAEVDLSAGVLGGVNFDPAGNTGPGRTSCHVNVIGSSTGSVTLWGNVGIDLDAQSEVGSSFTVDWTKFGGAPTSNFISANGTAFGGTVDLFIPSIPPQNTVTFLDCSFFRDVTATCAVSPGFQYYVDMKGSRWGNLKVTASGFVDIDARAGLGVGQSLAVIMPGAIDRDLDANVIVVIVPMAGNPTLFYKVPFPTYVTPDGISIQVNERKDVLTGGLLTHGFVTVSSFQVLGFLGGAGSGGIVDWIARRVT
jgi:hypothetical protein